MAAHPPAGRMLISPRRESHGLFRSRATDHTFIARSQFDDEMATVACKRSRSQLDSSELDGSSEQDDELGGTGQREAGAGSPGRGSPRRTEKQQQRARNKACREKSRREFLNDCFCLLAEVVGTEPPLKDKGSILRGAIKEIRALREEGARIKSENERLDRLLKLIMADQQGQGAALAAAAAGPKRAVPKGSQAPAAQHPWAPMHGLLQSKGAAAGIAGAQQEAELVQHRDFLPLWLDPSEFNEAFDNTLHPPVA